MYNYIFKISIDTLEEQLKHIVRISWIIIEHYNIYIFIIYLPITLVVKFFNTTFE